MELPRAPGDLGAQLEANKGRDWWNNLINLSAGIGSQVLIANTLNYLAPSLFSGWLYLPMQIALHASGIPSIVSKGIYNVLKRATGHGVDDPLLARAAGVITSTAAPTADREQFAKLITEFNNSKVQINNLVHEINAKQISPTGGATDITKLAQNLVQIRANIARALNDKPGERHELNQLQHLLDLELKALADMRVNREHLRHASIAARDAKLFQATNAALRDIQETQAQVRQASVQAQRQLNILDQEMVHIPQRPQPQRPKPELQRYAEAPQRRSSSRTRRAPPLAPKKQAGPAAWRRRPSREPPRQSRRSPYRVAR